MIHLVALLGFDFFFGFDFISFLPSQRSAPSIGKSSARSWSYLDFDIAVGEADRIQALLDVLEAIADDDPDAIEKIKHASNECGRLFEEYKNDGTGRVVNWYLTSLTRVRTVAQRILGEREGALFIPAPWESI